MIVITADQVDSRSTPDLVAGVLDDLNGDPGVRLTLEADRTAGDEIQMLAGSGADAIAVILRLTRTGTWSVGCGVGAAQLARGVRESSGDAFIAARSAVERAKKRGTRFALVGAGTAASARASAGGSGGAGAAADAEALIDLLLVLRERRTAEGWQLHDLLQTGLTQADAASRLGISPQAASNRARVAELRTEAAAVGALARLLEALDAGDA